MDRSVQRIGLSNVVVLLLVGATSTGVALYSQSLSGRISLLFVALSFLVAVVSYFQMRLEHREALEALELQEMARSAQDSALFSSTDSEIFPAQRAREQFERYFLPVFSIILFLLEAAGAWLLWGWLSQPTTALQQPQQEFLPMALFALFGLILFLLGKYAAGLARIEKQRLLRPGASHLLLTAYIFFLVTAALAAAELGRGEADRYAATALVALLGLVAVENLINLILEIYRPRTRRHEERLIYESRLVGFLAQPQGLITTVAQALDYQFGFKVSETWFYRFLERALGWLILAQVGLLFLSTSLVFIEPSEQGLLERLGKPVEGRSLLGPGAHIKFPWPIDKVYRHKTTEIQAFEIGRQDPPEGREERGVVVWTQGHHEEGSHLLVGGRPSAIEEAAETGQQESPPINLVDASIPVQFQTTNLVQWAYEHRDARRLLENVAEREVVRYLAGTDFFDVMTTGKAAAADELRRRIQERADELRLGVRILYVGLQNIHPPPEVAGDFQDVIGATQDSEAAVLRAEGYRENEIPLARARAARQVREAETYEVQTTTNAVAEASQFTNRLAAFEASPKIFTQRAYLKSLEVGAADAKKIVLSATNTEDVINLNLEEAIRPDLLDVEVQDQ